MSLDDLRSGTGALKGDTGSVRELFEGLLKEVAKAIESLRTTQQDIRDHCRMNHETLSEKLKDLESKLAPRVKFQPGGRGKRS